LDTVKCVLKDGGFFTVNTPDLRRYLEAVGVLCGTCLTFARASVRNEGSRIATYHCYRAGAPLPLSQ
jgi:hypothetical protein